VWAIVSWLFVGHGAFLLIGTTTFASVVLLVANSLQIQEFVAGQIGQFLTRSTGLQVAFGSAEPNWRDGRLSFRDVRVVCGPPAEAEDGNYTRFDLRVDRFDVNISLARMLEGRGLARSCAIEGLRGTVDRRFVRPADGWRYEARAGDFELDSVSLRDAQVEVLSADFRPFSVAVIHAELPRLRKRLLLYDLLCTESAVGVFDRSLFSVHMPSGADASAKRYCEQIRHLKVDGVSVDHFGAGTGPLAWLQKGAIDIDAVLQLPSGYRRPSEDLLDSLNETLGNIKENVLISILDPQRHEDGRAGHDEQDADSVLMGRERLLQFRDAYLAPLLSRLRKRTPFPFLFTNHHTTPHHAPPIRHE
jgi:distribution and morphology protein 31